MKCDVLVSEKMGSIPLAECGGAILTPGDELIVGQNLAAKMQTHYGSKLVKAGEVERTKLAGGQYEVVRKGASVYAVDPHAKIPSHEASQMQGMVADKSMFNKRTKKKVVE